MTEYPESSSKSRSLCFSLGVMVGNCLSKILLYYLACLFFFFLQIIHSDVEPIFDGYILQEFFTSCHYKKGNNASHKCHPECRTQYCHNACAKSRIDTQTRMDTSTTEGQNWTSSIVDVLTHPVSANERVQSFFAQVLERPFVSTVQREQFIPESLYLWSVNQL